MQSTVVIEALRVAAAPLAAALPPSAWLPHRLVRLANGRLDKPPCEGSVSNNPSTWVTLDRALELLITRPAVAGIGFAITPGIVSLDYDHCRDPVTGVLHPIIQEELERFNSFAYVTPSGTGIRIVGLNSAGIPGGKRVRVLPGGLPENDLRVEIFVGPTNHYNTLTGDVLPGYETLRDISDETLDYLTGLPERQASVGTGERAQSDGQGDGRASDEAVAAALSVMANGRLDWNEWSRVGMAAWRASGGSEAGFAAWLGWSAKHPAHDPAACQERWEHWFRSPPTKVGFQTLYALARLERPLFVPPFGVTTGDGEAGEAGEAGEDYGAVKPDRFRLMSLAEVEAMRPPGWLIEGVLPAGGLAVLYGAPKSGKTFLALAMALHIAWGQPWAGREATAAGVVYIAGEGVGGMGVRLRAARAQFGIPQDIPFWMVPGALDWTDQKLADRLMSMVRAAVGPQPVGLVVIDTLARAMPGADENSARDVGLVIATAARVQAGLACAVMAIHHQGKDEARGMRGTSALRGAVDASFRVTASEDVAGKVTLENEDQKDAETSPDMVFGMVRVPVPGTIGKVSLVPVLAQPEAAREGGDVVGRAEPRGQAKRALEILVDVIAGPEGAILPPLEGLPANGALRGVSEEVFRREYYVRNPHQLPGTRQKTFRRAVDDLIEMRRVGAREPWIWLVR